MLVFLSGGRSGFSWDLIPKSLAKNPETLETLRLLSSSSQFQESEFTTRNGFYFIDYSIGLTIKNLFFGPFS